MTTTQIQVRRDTAANWTSRNPTMAAGEPGFETDTGKFKMGDGSTAWSSLPYFVRAASGVHLERTTTQSINDSALTDITWPTEISDVDGWHVASSATVTVPRAGWGIVTSQIQWAANSTGARAGQHVVNAGATEYSWVNIPASASLGGTTPSFTITSHVLFAANDTVKTQAFQDSGGALNIAKAKMFVILFG